MDPDELEALLRESEPVQAAELVAAMEPDEAVDALRDLTPDEREEILEHMSEDTARHLSGLLDYREDQAGGFMTTVLVRAHPEETVEDVRRRLAERADHRSEIDAVAVVDNHGVLLGDLALFDFIVAEAHDLVADLLGSEDRAAPLTVNPGAGVEEVASRLVESRRYSVLVVDEEDRPLGRILADDVLDALAPAQGRMHFPRLLQ